MIDKAFCPPSLRASAGQAGRTGQFSVGDWRHPLWFSNRFLAGHAGRNDSLMFAYVRICSLNGKSSRGACGKAAVMQNAECRNLTPGRRRLLFLRLFAPICAYLRLIFFGQMNAKSESRHLDSTAAIHNGNGPEGKRDFCQTNHPIYRKRMDCNNMQRFQCTTGRRDPSPQPNHLPSLGGSPSPSRRFFAILASQQSHFPSKILSTPVSYLVRSDFLRHGRQGGWGKCG
jgi:hypothetical protein